MLLASNSNNTLTDITASNNTIYGVYLVTSSDNYFTEMLKVGSNTTENCYESGGVNPGLVDTTCTTTGLTGSNTYGIGNTSDATFTNAVSTAGSFVNSAVGDYSLWDTDTVLYNVHTPPTGNDTLTHTWSDLTNTTFLMHAVEIHGDSIGDDNNLCETDETCLFTPNMGSYQGHGALINATPAFIDGAVLTGITLKRYETNGY